jgi:hypothetical protein
MKISLIFFTIKYIRDENGQLTFAIKTDPIFKAWIVTIGSVFAFFWAAKWLIEN